MSCFVKTTKASQTTIGSKTIVVSKNEETSKLLATAPTFIARSVVTQTKYHPTFVPGYRSPGIILSGWDGVNKEENIKNMDKRNICFQIHLIFVIKTIT